ncbi:MAG: hypothetical protein ACE14V_01690 [bacterium]
MKFRIIFLSILTISLIAISISSSFGDESTDTFSFATNQRYSISTGQAQLFIPGYYVPDGDNIDVLFHMHGAYSTVENDLLLSGKNCVLINVTFNGLSGVYSSYFSDQTIFRTILNSAMAKLKSLGYASNPRVRFLCVSAWSAGFGGVRDLINSTSYYTTINALCMLDCPYASYYPSAPTVSSTDMAPFLKFAKEAVLGSKTYFMSHTEILTPYASTSETAEYLINNVGTTRQSYSGTNSYGMLYRSKTEWNKFYIHGFQGNTAQDHMNHLYAAYLFLDYIKFPSEIGNPVFPYSDTFPSSGRQLYWWANKFTSPAITAFSPTSPGGDGYVLVVKDPSGGYESTRIGNSTDSDYFVQSDIYCQYRSDVASDGFERYGIFARDSGNGGFEGTTGGGGYCYLMAYDSNSGRLWCGKSINGVITDFNTTPIYYPSTAWRKFRIECSGNRITYKLDNSVVCSITDTSYHSGLCGIGFHEYFTTNSNMLGTRVDNFYADLVTTTGISNWMLYQ